MSERPVSHYAVEHGIKHTVLNNAIRDFLKGKPWGLKAQKVSMTTMYIVEQEDFDAWYARYQQNRQKRKKGKTAMSTYGLDITNLSDLQRGDVSQRIHELMGEAVREDLGGIKQIGNRQIGLCMGVSEVTVSILKDEGYNVEMYHGCGHCFQGMPDNGGRCDCECHNSAS